jgi:hypothetical protein
MFIVSIWNIKPSTFDNFYVQTLDIKYFILLGLDLDMTTHHCIYISLTKEKNLLHALI